MTLYRFLFAPVLLTIAAFVAPPPSSPAAPPPTEARAQAPASSEPQIVPTALQRAGTAGPIRAR